MNALLWWARAGLTLNFLGAIALLFSFQASSSHFRLITTASGDSALCVNKRALIVSNVNGGENFGDVACPDWEHSKAAAVVNLEFPWLVSVGSVFTVGGFFIQLLTLRASPNSVDVTEFRRELRKARDVMRKSDTA